MNKTVKIFDPKRTLIDFVLNTSMEYTYMLHEKVSS